MRTVYSPVTGSVDRDLVDKVLFVIRTTDDQHKMVVRNILIDLEKRGEIYKSSYQGWYCTPDETFWTEAELSDHEGDAENPV